MFIGFYGICQYCQYFILINLYKNIYLFYTMHNYIYKGFEKILPILTMDIIFAQTPCVHRLYECQYFYPANQITERSNAQKPFIYLHFRILPYVQTKV